MKHPTGEQPCQALCADMAKRKEFRGGEFRKPCRFTAIDVRADGDERPRLVCGVHLRQADVRWQGGATALFIDEDRLRADMLEKVLAARHLRVRLCRRWIAKWQQELQWSEQLLKGTKDAYRMRQPA